MTSIIFFYSTAEDTTESAQPRVVIYCDLAGQDEGATLSDCLIEIPNEKRKLFKKSILELLQDRALLQFCKKHTNEYLF